MGRFINADALVSTGQGILGNNMFTYCLNNPVRYEDLQGYLAVEEGDSEEDPTGNNINDFTGGAKTPSANGGGCSGFRSGLQKLTGQSGKDSDAHHIFPVHFEEPFNKLDIEIHDPAFGAWWESHSHRQASHAYNLWWDAFFSIDGVTREDAFALVQFLSVLFGFDTNY